MDKPVIRLDSIEADRLYTQVELCSLLGRSKAWAERARWQRVGPPFIRIGRTPMYAGRDLRRWIESGLVATIDAKAAA